MSILGMDNKKQDLEVLIFPIVGQLSEINDNLKKLVDSMNRGVKIAK